MVRDLPLIPVIPAPKVAGMIVNNIPAKKRRFPHRLVFRVALRSSRLRMDVISKVAFTAKARLWVSWPQHATTTVRYYSIVVLPTAPGLAL